MLAKQENSTLPALGMGKSRPRVSVIIPTLNEAINLPLVLPYLPLDEIDEVILVDGRSTDGTIDVARRLLPSIKIVLEQKPGKGSALRRGYEASTGDIIVVLDADGSNDPREIPRFVRALMEGADMVKGSRFAPQGGTTDMPRIRKMGNGGFVLLTNLLYGTSFTDLCYGYHAFWRYCLDTIDVTKVDGFEIDTAIYLQALSGNLRLVEVPSFEGYRFYGEGKLQTFPDGWRVLRTIFHEWSKSVRTKPLNLKRGFRGAKATYQPMLSEGSWSVMKTGYVVSPIEHKIEQLRLSLELLYSLGQESSSEPAPRILLEQILRIVLDSIEAVSGSLVLLDEQGQVSEGYLIFQGKSFQLSGSNLIDVIQHGLAGWVIKNREPALVPSTHEDPRWLKRSWEKQMNLERSAIGIPLFSNNELMGALVMVGQQACQFTEADLDLFSQVLVER